MNSERYFFGYKFVFKESFPDEHQHVWKSIDKDLGFLRVLSCTYARPETTFSILTGLHFLIYLIALLCNNILLSLTMYYSYLEGNIEITTQSMYYTILSCLSTVLLVLSSFKKSILFDVCNMAYTGFSYDDADGLEVHELKENSRNIINRFSLASKMYASLCFLYLLIGPITDNLFDKKTESVSFSSNRLPYPLWFPFDTSNASSYTVTFLYEIFISIAIIPVTLVPTFSFLMLNQTLRGNLTILNYCTEHIEERATVTFYKRYPNLAESVTSSREHIEHQGSYFDECFLHSLNQTAKHYLFIKRMSIKIQELGTWPYIYTLACGPVLIATAVFAFLSDSPTLSYRIAGIVVCSGSIASIGMVCWYGEELKSLSEDHLNLLYFCDWTKRSVKVRRTLFLMQTAEQKEITPIYSHINVTVNLNAFKEVLNAAYTYVTCILTLRSTHTI